MVIHICMRYLNSPIDYRMISRKEVWRNIEDERAKKTKNSPHQSVDEVPCEDRTPVPKICGGKQARPFAIAKTDFSSYYFFFPARHLYD